MPFWITCNYNAPDTFARAFRQRFGQSPSSEDFVDAEGERHVTHSLGLVEQGAGEVPPKEGSIRGFVS